MRKTARTAIQGEENDVAADSRKEKECAGKASRRGGGGRRLRGLRLYSAAAAAGALLSSCGLAFAAGGDPIAVVNNLSVFIFGLIRAVGLILLGFGIVQIGLSLKSHDPSQRANGFLTLAGGVIITFTKEILDLIVGG